MASKTPINALRKPDQTDAPLGGIQISALADDLDGLLNARFATVAERDQKIPQPREGMECFLSAQSSPVVLPARKLLYAYGAWRLIGPSPLQPIASPFTEVGGSANPFGTNPQTLTSVLVPYPGFPFVISALARAEIGSTQAGTRWDSRIVAQNADGTGTATLIDKYEGTDGQITYHRMSQPGPNGRVFETAVRVRFEALTAYGAALGNINTGSDRAFAVWVYGI